MSEKIDLDKIEALAKAATPGPYWNDSGETSFGLFLGNGSETWGREHPAWMLCVDGESGYANGAADANYLAALDPATVLALVARARRANELEDGEPDDMTMLLAADVGWLRDGKLVLNMNDTWAWACADAETVPPEELENVADLFRRYGRAGLLYWTSRRRGGERSEFKDNNRFIDFVAQEEGLCEREPSSSKRAYINLSYTLGGAP